MKPVFILSAALFVVSFLSAESQAQIVTYYAPAPVVVSRPIVVQPAPIVAPAPVVVARPVVVPAPRVTYYAPAPVVAAPVVAAPVAVAPVTTYYAPVRRPFWRFRPTYRAWAPAVVVPY